jgi:hypothetical protein
VEERGSILTPKPDTLAKAPKRFKHKIQKYKDGRHWLPDCLYLLELCLVHYVYLSNILHLLCPVIHVTHWSCECCLGKRELGMEDKNILERKKLISQGLQDLSGCSEHLVSYKLRRGGRGERTGNSRKDVEALRLEEGAFAH